MSRYSIYSYLCYPDFNELCIESRIKKLREVGVVSLSGFLGKGHSSVVLEAVMSSGEKTAVKILRTDSKRSDLTVECLLMRKTYPISPQVIACGEEYIVMEVVRGTSAEKALVDHRTRLSTMLKILAAGRGLDIAHVDHEELSRAHKHVVLTPNGRIKILDFESASLSGSPCNVCRLASWLAYRLGYLRMDADILIQILRDYKRAEETKRMEIFRRLIEHVVLCSTVMGL